MVQLATVVVARVESEVEVKGMYAYSQVGTSRGVEGQRRW